MLDFDIKISKACGLKQLNDRDLMYIRKNVGHDGKLLNKSYSVIELSFFNRKDSEMNQISSKIED